MRKIFLITSLLLVCVRCYPQLPPNDTNVSPPLVLGAYQMDTYLPKLTGHTVALVVNQSSVVGNSHLLDTLLARGIKVRKVFAPEHGFRGDKDAGETVDSSTDKKTGVSIVSLYGNSKKPSDEAMKGISMVVFDIQDVGTRFFTYISTLHYVMEACAEKNVPLIVLDRPNPNGHYVAGPILEADQKSFVGMHPIPIVHGMTIGEYAQMINGEQWLGAGKKCPLEVITMQGWHHRMPYSLPIKPSPNLPNDQSIALYPSICLFEGTVVSVGRGTTSQFQVIGHPDLPATGFTFTPVSREGAKTPPLQDQLCHGLDLTNEPVDGFTLKYLMQAYQALTAKGVKFFNNYFPKLAGTKKLQQQIEAGMTEAEIVASWQDGLEGFKSIRKKYLLYTDFE